MSTYTSNYGWTKPEGSDPVDIGVLNGNLDSQDSIVHNAYMQLAPVFSTASTYAVDDVVLYSNNLYKCHTAVTVAGDWDASKWTQVKVSDIAGGGGGGGTSDYTQLSNKPSINSVTLEGNKTASDLGLAEETTVITWADWILLTPQEQASGDYTVINCPWADGDVSVDLLEKLWENPNPTSNMASGTEINLLNTDYDILLVLSKVAVGSAVYVSTIAPKGNNINIAASTAGASYMRNLTYVSNTKYTAGQGSQVGGSNFDNICVPIAIYGIKTTASVKINAVAMDVKASVEYSTSERLIGKWIDGSDLYEKTIDFGELPNATRKSVAHNISNLGIIVDIRGVAVKSTDTLPIPFTSIQNINNSVQVFATLYGITIDTGLDRSTYSGYVTLRYTKTN